MGLLVLLFSPLSRVDQHCLRTCLDCVIVHTSLLSICSPEQTLHVFRKFWTCPDFALSSTSTLSHHVYSWASKHILGCSPTLPSCTTVTATPASLAFPNNYFFRSLHHYLFWFTVSYLTLSPNIYPTAISLISSLVYPPAISVFGNLGFCSCWSSYIIYNSSLAYQPFFENGHPDSCQQVHQSFLPAVPPSSPAWLCYLKPTVFCTSFSTSISILLLQCSIGVSFSAVLGASQLLKQACPSFSTTASFPSPSGKHYCWFAQAPLFTTSSWCYHGCFTTLIL